MRVSFFIGIVLDWTDENYSSTATESNQSAGNTSLPVFYGEDLIFYQVGWSKAPLACCFLTMSDMPDLKNSRKITEI